MANSGEDHEKWLLSENDFKGYRIDGPLEVMLALVGRIAKAKYQSEALSKGENRKFSEKMGKSVARASSTKARVAAKGIVIRDAAVENNVNRVDDLRESIHQLLIDPGSDRKGKSVDVGGCRQAWSHEEESLKSCRSARVTGCEMEVGESSGSKEEIKRKRKCSRKNVPGPSRLAPAPPTMPREFMDSIASMGGKEIMLVIQKDLTESDMSNQLCRLSIPAGQICKDSNFLREGEKMRLEASECMTVKVLCPNLSEEYLVLKLWEMRKDRGRDDGKEPKPKATFMYILRTGWNKVAAASKLRMLDTIQVWSFRVDSDSCPDELRFAVVKVPQDGNCRTSDSGGSSGHDSLA